VNAFYFGARERRLFGIFTPASAKKSSARAAALCYPWGQEYIRAHRSMRRLAVQLSDAGFDVLRFDYFGTGDSAGEPRDADLAGLRRDIETAVDELKDMTSASRVALVGMRLGATLAAQLAARPRKDIDALALWDPVISGSVYWRELAGSTRIEGVGEQHVLGFRVPAAMVRELNAIDLASCVSTLPTRTLIVVTDPAPAPAEWTEALQRRGGAAPAVERIACQPAWVKTHDWGAGTVPVPVLQRLVDWLS
jgi:pimeloyl-ACP methyl ester carboxylesterase